MLAGNVFEHSMHGAAMEGRFPTVIRSRIANFYIGLR